MPLTLTAPGASALVEQPSGPLPDAPQRVIVQWAPGTGPAEKAGARADAEVSYAANLGSPLFQLVEVEDGQGPVAAVAELEADPAVVLAERDRYRAPNALTNDPMIDQLWGLQNNGVPVGGFGGAALAGADIDIEGAWLHTRGDPGVVVADIDSGFQFEHPELAGAAWTNPGETPANGLDDDGNGYVDDLHGYDFVGANAETIVPDPDPSDDDVLSGGHGVHTAGTIAAAADNATGIAGVAPEARLMPLRVCSRVPSVAANRCAISAIVSAINYAGKEGAQVANMSLGGTSRSQAEVNAMAANPGTLFVVSAGNDGVDNAAVPHFPCDFNPAVDASPAVPGAIDNVICVAATNQADGLAGFSDWGANTVDLGAPGTETLSTYPLDYPYEEPFTIDDFAIKWAATGANGGFERTIQGPLTSFGVTDTIGAPVPETVRESTSEAFTLPPNKGCVLFQNRHVELADDGDEFRYSLLLDGVPTTTTTGGQSTAKGLEPRSLILPASFNAGGQVQIRLRFTAGAGTLPASGVWVDDLRLRCLVPTYAFLQGTSMAAPHVSGVAALLFSRQPGASVGAVKAALLGGAEAIPSLSGKTVTGGRLNAAGAIQRLDAGGPAAPTISTNPASPAANGLPAIVGTAEPATTVRIYAGAGCTGPPIAGGSAANLASPGIVVPVNAESTVQFSATATDSAQVSSACSAPVSYTNTSQVVIVAPPPPPPPPPQTPTCKVPKLAGKTLLQAKAVLKRARCRVGKATKPKPRRGQRRVPLVVKFSNPRAGATTGGKVNLRLGPRPQAKKATH